MTRLLLIGIALLAIGTGTVRAEEKAIHWMLTGVPPKFISDGPFQGTGYGQQQVAYLAKRLPQFHHRVELVTPARLWHEMQIGKGICSIDIADLPEREAWAVFTRHHTSVPGYRMLVLRDRVSEFALFRLSDGSIDLDRLAASGRLTGLYVASRHYTPKINAFIESRDRKISLESTSSSTKIFEMIASRRGDFSFGAVTEMNYFNALNAVPPTGGKSLPPLAMLAIKDSGETVQGHIACSRDPLGREMINALDRLFDDETAWNEFFAPQQRWLDNVPVAPP